MRSRNRRQRGGELIEFALVTSCLLPLLFGTVVVGLNLVRAIQLTQVSRDAGHMYARSVDFSLSANKQLIVRLSQGLNITATGGSGVVILSTITHIGEKDCAAGGLSTSQCINLNQSVFTHRIVVGNAAVRASSFGTPNAALIDSTGKVSNYLRESSARANGFPAVLALQSGEFAYVSEAYVQSPANGFPGYQSTGVYARTVF